MADHDATPPPPPAARERARIGRCPHCGSRTRLDASNTWRPFCSERCKLVDLEGWFGGRYYIAGEPDAAPTFLDDPGYNPADDQ